MQAFSMQIRFFLLAGFFLYSPLLGAVPVADIYRITLPVTSRQAEERTSLLQQAFQAVMVRASGTGDIASQPAVIPQLTHSENFVNEYSYIKSDNGQGLQLAIHFDPEAVNSLLEQAGFPAWGTDRPLIAIFILNESDKTAHILTETGGDADFAKALMVSAQRYGLPVIFPLMDLDDVRHVTPGAILTDNQSVLDRAAARYGSDALLTGRLHAVPGGWQLIAMLSAGPDHWQWELGGTVPAELFADLAERAAGILSARAAVAREAQAAVLSLTINGIESSGQIRILTEELGEAPGVSKVEVLQIFGDRVILRVHFRASTDVFRHGPAMSAHLLPIRGASDEYQWKE